MNIGLFISAKVCSIESEGPASSATRQTALERRRCEIARSLIITPKFLLLDEPFAGVDPIAVSDIQSIVRDLKKLGIGVLITDHNVRETLAICDRAYVIKDGSLLASGSANEVANNKLVRTHYLGEEFKFVE